jgi:hypothetical protein
MHAYLQVFFFLKKKWFLNLELVFIDSFSFLMKNLKKNVFIYLKEEEFFHRKNKQYIMITTIFHKKIKNLNILYLR